MQQRGRLFLLEQRRRPVTRPLSGVPYMHDSAAPGGAVRGSSRQRSVGAGWGRAGSEQRATRAGGREGPRARGAEQRSAPLAQPSQPASQPALTMAADLLAAARGRPGCEPPDPRILASRRPAASHASSCGWRLPSAWSARPALLPALPCPALARPAARRARSARSALPSRGSRHCCFKPRAVLAYRPRPRRPRPPV